MKLQIYKTNGQYSFLVDGFSSIHHYPIVSGTKPKYKLAYEAIKDAKYIYRNKMSNIKELHQTKYAVEDLKIG
jgi:hypothetical protein